MTLRAALGIWVATPKNPSLSLNPYYDGNLLHPTQPARSEPKPSTGKNLEPKCKHSGSKDAIPCSPSANRCHPKEKNSKRSKKHNGL